MKINDLYDYKTGKAKEAILYGPKEEIEKLWIESESEKEFYDALWDDEYLSGTVAALEIFKHDSRYLKKYMKRIMPKNFFSTKPVNKLRIGGYRFTFTVPNVVGVINGFNIAIIHNDEEFNVNFHPAYEFVSELKGGFNIYLDDESIELDESTYISLEGDYTMYICLGNILLIKKPI